MKKKIIPKFGISDILGVYLHFSPMLLKLAPTFTHIYKQIKILYTFLFYIMYPVMNNPVQGHSSACFCVYVDQCFVCPVCCIIDTLDIFLFSSSLSPLGLLCI